MKRLLLSCSVLWVVNISYPQQSIIQDEVDLWVNTHMATKHIPGLALAVVQHGQVVKEAFYGASNVETNTAVNEQTVFEIASMTKQMVCAAMLLLQEDGKLSLHDRLSLYLDDLPATWQAITLVQLMNHTSGLRDDWDEPTSYFFQYNTNDLLVKAQQEHPLLFTPGEGFNYSSGPFFLGLVIEKVTGNPYSQFLEERIFTPLGMTSTSVYHHRKIVPGRAAGYRWYQGQLENGEDIPPGAESRADVGVQTTLADMIKWDRALRDNQLLSSESLHAMFSRGMLNSGKSIPYGYGWYIYSFRNKWLQEHSGAFRTGFSSMIVRFPKDGVEVILLCNLWQAGLTDLATQIASYYLKDFQRASELPPQRDVQPGRTRQLETLFSQLAQKKFSRGALYQVANFSGFDPEELADLLQGFISLEFIDQAPHTTNAAKKETLLYYKAIAANITYWSFVFADTGALVAVNLED